MSIYVTEGLNQSHKFYTVSIFLSSKHEPYENKN